MGFFIFRTSVLFLIIPFHSKFSHLYFSNVGSWVVSKVTAYCCRWVLKSDYLTFTSSEAGMYIVLLHFSLSVKAVTLIFIYGRDLAISYTHEGKTGNINGKTENFNCLIRVNKYKLDSVKQKDP